MHDSSYINIGKRRYLYMTAIMCGDLMSDGIPSKELEDAQRSLISGLLVSANAGFSVDDLHSYESYVLPLEHYNESSTRGPRIIARTRPHTYHLVSCFFARYESIQDALPDFLRIATIQQQLGVPMPKLYVLKEGTWETWIHKITWAIEK